MTNKKDIESAKGLLAKLDASLEVWRTLAKAHRKDLDRERASALTVDQVNLKSPTKACILPILDLAQKAFEKFKKTQNSRDKWYWSGKLDAFNEVLTLLTKKEASP